MIPEGEKEGLDIPVKSKIIMYKFSFKSKALLVIILLFSADYLLFSQEKDSKRHEFTYALIEASRLKMTGSLDEAVKLYTFCVETDSKCAAAWYELASIYSATGKVKEAEEFVKKAYDLDNSNYWYVVAYADILDMNKNHEEAIKLLKKASRTFKNKDELFFKYSLADSYFNAGKSKKALKTLNRIEDKYGKSELITLRRVDFYKERGNHDMVIRSFKDFIHTDPDNIHINLKYAEYLFENEQYNDAVKIYEDILEIDESNIYAISNLADIYNKIGNDDKSLSFLAEAFRSDYLSFQKKIQTLSFLLSDEKRLNNSFDKLQILLNILLGYENDNYDLLLVAYDLYYKKEIYEKSLEIIRKLVELKNDNYILWMQAVYNANMLDKHDMVIEFGEEALKIFPNKDDLRVFIALAWYNKENFTEAYKMLKESGSRFSEPELARQKQILIAETAYKSGNIEEAFYYFEELILNEPENLYAKNNYAYYLVLEGLNLEKAKELSFETIKKEPENSSFLDTYAWILFNLKETENAEKFIRKAIEFDKSNSQEIIDHFIEIMIYNGKEDEAERIKNLMKDE